MAGLARRVATAAALAALGLGPVGAQAEPSFNCETRSLIVGAAEVNGVRVTCSVSGATDDQLLRVVGDRPLPVCEADLTDGNGACGGMLLGSPDVGQILAVLEPSGTQFDVRSRLAVPTAPLQYFPLPEENAGSTDVDEPTPETSAD